MKAESLRALARRFPDHVPEFVVIGAKEDVQAAWSRVSQVFEPGEKVAFRSSAGPEDGDERSFAGMFDTFLDVPWNREAFVRHVARVRESKDNPRLTAYLRGSTAGIVVDTIVQRMFPTHFSGVAFVYPDGAASASWVSISDRGQVVGGADALEAPLEELAGRLPEGVSPDLWARLARALVLAQQDFGHPADIEFGIGAGDFALFQIRPITASGGRPWPARRWDATNIAENYPGVTAPLTYSFIRTAYAAVYASFLAMLGVRSRTIRQHRGVLENMLGYLYGHVYYNIDNWYRFLQLLPFYRQNQAFFQNMLQPKGEQPQESPAFKIDLLVVWHLFTKVLFPGRQFRFFERRYRTLMDSYASYDKPSMSLWAILEAFERLSGAFFSVWGITILNDFRLMVFYGLLTRMAERWIPEEKDRYLNSIISARSHPESIAPIKMLYRIAAVVSQSETAAAKFRSTPPRALWEEIQRDESLVEVKREIERYLQKYGDRSAHELKIEVPKFRERPDQLVGLIAQYVGLDLPQAAPAAAEVLVRSGPLRRRLLGLLSGVTVASIHRREAYRLKRGFVFGMVREVFLHIGGRLRDLGLLESPEDVFYLYKDEIWAGAGMHALENDFLEVVRRRKRVLEGYRRRSLRVRVESRADLLEQLSAGEVDAGGGTQEAFEFAGKVTSYTPAVEAQALVLEEFDLEADLRGKILVTRKTDPGWTVLFPLLKGVVTEKGNSLSHASIIARELRIPCFVEVDRAVDLIRTGDRLRLDPQAQKITVLKR